MRADDGLERPPVRVRSPSRAGTTTATAASDQQRHRRRTARRRRARRRATTASRTAVPTTAKSVVRESGTAWPFQMPPRPARLRSVPRPGSARAANWGTPACVMDRELRHQRVRPATAARRAPPTPSDTAAQQPSGAPGPGASAARQRDRRREQQTRRRQAGQRDPERQRPPGRVAVIPSAVAAPRRPPTEGSRTRPAGSSGPAEAVLRHRDSTRRASRRRTGPPRPAAGTADRGQVRGTPAGEPQSRRSAAP